MSLLQLFLIFIYVGAFTIGGGLVAISLMQQQLVAPGIISADEFINMIAISESTPGPIGINMATYVGYKFYGVPGALITTTGTVLPSLVCIVLIARFFTRYQETPLVRSVFYGLRAGSCGMIMYAVWQVLSISLLDIPAFTTAAEAVGGHGAFFSANPLSALAALFPPVLLIMALVAALIYGSGKVHPLVLIALGAAGGVIFL